MNYCKKIAITCMLLVFTLQPAFAALMNNMLLPAGWSIDKTSEAHGARKTIYTNAKSNKQELLIVLNFHKTSPKEYGSLLADVKHSFKQQQCILKSVKHINVKTIPFKQQLFSFECPKGYVGYTLAVDADAANIYFYNYRRSGTSLTTDDLTRVRELFSSISLCFSKKQCLQHMDQMDSK